MEFNKRKIVNTSFLLFSLVFAIVLSYTSHVYFIVFAGVRNIVATVSLLKVNVVNSSYIQVETPIIIQNPSECTFELLQITEGVYLKKPRTLVQILIKSKAWNNLQIQPLSTVNVTIQAEVPSQKIRDVTTHLDQDWIADARIHFRGPMVGIFSWHYTWLITEITQT